MKSRDGERAERSWASRFLRNLLLWAVPVTLVWILLTPYYNRFLTVSAERLLRLTESPAATGLTVGEHVKWDSTAGHLVADSVSAADDFGKLVAAESGGYADVLLIN